MSKYLPPRPFVKWAGGKAQLLNELLLRTPKKFEKYFEPFVGGGAFFFALCRKKKIKKAYLSDLNSELIDTYHTIRDNVDCLVERLQKYENNKDIFYEIRAQDPAKLELVERAARMIYLNKTCFNGLYRVNRQGRFNVPFGSYKSPKICDLPNLLKVSRVLAKVEIECNSFENVVDKAKAGDLVYFDPPYQPISKTAKFTSYQASGFDQNSQKHLQEVCHLLTERGINFILSNSAADLIRELYDHNGFYLHQVSAIRAINSNPHKRGKLTELIVTNFKARPTSEKMQKSLKGS